MAHNVIDIANAIISLSQPEYGDYMSNLKLQKLLYYTQGFSLVLLGRPLFNEDVKAWSYGPVVEEAYHKFKRFRSGVVKCDPGFSVDVLTDEEYELIKEVYVAYGQFSALRLMEMTHEELPWMQTPRNNVISHELMKLFFSSRVKDVEED